MAEPSVVLFGPIDTFVAPYIEYVILALVLVNLIARKVANDAYVRGARDDGEDGVTRSTFLTATDLLLVVASFYYLTLHHHSGMVLSVLVLGMVIADFFEFEARLVEARNDMAVESPKGAIVASLLVLLYAGFLSLFVFIKPIWAEIFSI